MDFQKILNREHWITQKGERFFPHQFDDEHLVNTIRYIKRQARLHRLYEAQQLCATVYHTGNRNADPEAFYRAYRQYMDGFLGDMSDTDWLKQNSKIYNLLVEEANYRKLDYSDNAEKKMYSKTLQAKKSRMPKISFSW